jgi:hypothetical protein
MKYCFQVNNYKHGEVREFDAVLDKFQVDNICM